MNFTGLIFGVSISLATSSPAETNAPGRATNSARDLLTIRRTGEQNDAEAQYKRGNSYFDGEGVAKDHVEAVKWYRKAAEQNYAPAQNCLGYAYAKGDGVMPSIAEAVKWYRKAAEQNYAKAQDNLGVLIVRGLGVKKDAKEAVEWFRKAAKQNYAPAQNNLGVAYENGEGVAKDQVDAMKWYRKAADQKDPDAQFNLGLHYEHGDAVVKNYTEAYRWYRLAAAQGSADAREHLRYIASKMTPEQIAEALPAPIHYTAKQIAEAKRIAIVQLSRFFKWERDQVDGMTTITSKEPAISDKGTEFVVMCFVDKDEPIPARVSFHITSHSRDWRFLDFSRLVVKYDDKKKIFEKLEDKGTVLHNGTVLEQMTASFSLKELREITLADSVQIAIGIEEFEFTDKWRAGWRALFQYFDVIKAEKNFNSVPSDPQQFH